MCRPAFNPELALDFGAFIQNFIMELSNVQRQVLRLLRLPIQATDRLAHSVVQMKQVAKSTIGLA
jgi:hypothetical protein